MNKKIDKQLQIETEGIIQYYSDFHHNRYEPTDYSVLDAILKYVKQEDTLIDYGCGKGRVDFYLHYKTNCHCIGIEYNEEVYQYALKNLQSSKMKDIEFILQDASEYNVPPHANIFYFFNPFSIQILRSVFYKILSSYYENQRNMYLIFYYPNEDYISFIANEDHLDIVEMIPLSTDPQEKLYIIKVID